MRKRLDEELVDRGLLNSRSEAKRFILEGKVLINGQVAEKPNINVNAHDNIELIEGKKYVSRGGFKLEHALEIFQINVNDLIALDIGVSTGGFTDCLLKKGVKKVYAVDVGYGQIDLSLRKDNRIILLERTNARYLSRNEVPEEVDIVTIDVSFISILKILPAISKLIKDNANIVSLIKPQFESNRRNLIKGVIKNSEVHIEILNSLICEIQKIGLNVVYLTYSPIKGGKGNIEYFFKINRYLPVVNLEEVSKIVIEAWEKVK